MKQWNFRNAGGAESQNALRGGAYALTISVVVLAILAAVNLLVSVLPARLTKYDISASKLYSITSNTKVVAGALEQDVTIYWVVQAGAEDEVLENLLSKYGSLSDHIKVVKKNPDVYPAFTQQYTDETVQNNSLIVECVSYPQRRQELHGIRPHLPQSPPEWLHSHTLRPSCAADRYRPHTHTDSVRLVRVGSANPQCGHTLSCSAR